MLRFLAPTEKQTAAASSPVSNCRLLDGPQRLLGMNEVLLPLSVLFVSTKCDPYNQCGPIGCAVITSYPGGILVPLFSLYPHP